MLYTCHSTFFSNSSPVLGKLLDNYFYNHFHFLKDYSMEVTVLVYLSSTFVYIVLTFAIQRWCNPLRSTGLKARTNSPLQRPDPVPLVSLCLPDSERVSKDPCHLQAVFDWVLSMKSSVLWPDLFLPTSSDWVLSVKSSVLSPDLFLLTSSAWLLAELIQWKNFCRDRLCEDVL